MMETEQKIQELVKAIRSLQPHLDKMSQKFREESGSGHPNFDKWSEQDWCRNAFGNALVRLRQLVEQNFQFIETMGLLVVARYIFELSVWLHLFKIDSRFGLIYYRELLGQQLRYYRDRAEHFRREVKLLKCFEQKDHQSIDAIQTSIASKEIAPSDIGALIKWHMDAVDAEASRQFSIFIDDAKTNGFGYQAHLVEQQAIPQTEKAIRQIEQELTDFEQRVPGEVQDLAQGRWNWKKMSRITGLTAEHDFIYSNASKLLHAMPVSLTTDEKNLTPQEIYIFLRYIYSKLLEIMDLARQRPEYGSG